MRLEGISAYAPEHVWSNARVAARLRLERMRTRKAEVGAMSPEEAVEQLELIGHDFFVFRNDDSGEINVVYRRRDGDYGLIEPQ